MKQDNSIIVFDQKKVRRVWDEKKEVWLFSVIDVIEVLTDTSVPRRYWSDLKNKLKNEGSEVYEKIVQLKMTASDGKERETDVFSTEDMFRVVQTIPSPKAEPFKLWLAKVGYERMREIEDPELATKRTRELYKAKGYDDAWIEKRMRGIAIREELTDVWKKRGIEKKNEFSILTAEISKAAFGMTPSEYKEYKGLKRENLRDHMNDLEQIFSMLGEASTVVIAKNINASGFEKNKIAAKKGGTIAGDARKKLESESGTQVSTRGNYLKEPQKIKRLLEKKKEARA